MNTITQISGGAQILLAISYDLQDCFEQYLSEDQQEFLAMLRLIKNYQPALERITAKTGRPAYENEPFFRGFLAKSFSGYLRTRTSEKGSSAIRISE